MKRAKLKMSLFPQRLRIVGLDEKGKYILRLRPETLDQLIQRQVYDQMMWRLQMEERETKNSLRRETKERANQKTGRNHLLIGLS